MEGQFRFLRSNSMAAAIAFAVQEPISPPDFKLSGNVCADRLWWEALAVLPAVPRLGSITIIRKVRHPAEAETAIFFGRSFHY